MTLPDAPLVVPPDAAPVALPDIAPLARLAHDLDAEMAWLARALDARFQHYFDLSAEPGAPADAASTSDTADEPDPDPSPPPLPAPPDLGTSDSALAAFVRRHQPGVAERLAIALCLAPHVRPQLLDVFHTRNKTFDRHFTEFGGVRDAQGDFQPTGDTLAFVLGGAALAPRLAVLALFDRDHWFARQGVLRPVPQAGDAGPLKAALRLSDDTLGRLCTGRPRRPDLSADFPARHIQTALDWADLVLHPGTLAQVQEIDLWLQHGQTLMQDWGMARKLRPGYRALFYGPPGTGKTMTACLLGRSTGRDVYQVDLSLVVSKFIGETEKNLSRVFDQAQHQGWILFFDEADALFGKRSETKDAHDRYANQEVAYLLQRIETFDGIVILASNQKDNIDGAFARRFESVIYFPLPRPEERLRLWRQGFSPQAQLAPGLDLDRLAAQHELCGGAIMNAVRHASLQALAQGGRLITPDALLQGIRREQAKDGKGG